MFAASRYVGGLYVSRSHKGDANAPKPLEVVPVERAARSAGAAGRASLQRQAVQFPPELYNHLAASHWDHWGTQVVERGDYPVHDIILMWQDRILSQLLSPLTLVAAARQRAEGAGRRRRAHHAPSCSSGSPRRSYSEVDTVKEGEFTNRKPAISSLRRNLQRAYLRRLSQLALGQTSAPEDCQTVAFAELGRLKTRIDTLLAGEAKLDSYTRAHLEETSARITKVVDATDAGVAVDVALEPASAGLLQSPQLRTCRVRFGNSPVMSGGVP